MAFVHDHAVVALEEVLGQLAALDLRPDRLHRGDINAIVLIPLACAKDAWFEPEPVQDVLAPLIKQSTLVNQDDRSLRALLDQEEDARQRLA
jgi:hypothetical protein